MMKLIATGNSCRRRCLGTEFEPDRGRLLADLDQNIHHHVNRAQTTTTVENHDSFLVIALTGW
jgi:hypothetical protein